MTANVTAMMLPIINLRRLLGIVPPVNKIYTSLSADNQLVLKWSHGDYPAVQVHKLLLNLKWWGIT